MNKVPRIPYKHVPENRMLIDILQRATSLRVEEEALSLLHR